MSTVSQGPGWWLASDGMWYPPVQSPGGVPQGPAGPSDPSVAPGQGQLPTFPGYVPTSGAPGYGPPPVSPGYGYGYPSGYPPYSYAQIQKTNGLAVASLVCSFFFWLYGLGALLAIVFGFIARSQIKHSGGWQKGKGLALAGIIIGFAGLVIGAVVFTIVVRHCNTSGHCTFNTTVKGGN